MPRGPSIHRVHKVLKRLKGRQNPHLDQLRTRVRKSPTSPGIYRWLDAKGNVLYVGKAKHLRKRLSWYVTPRPGAFVGPWRDSFLQQIADFDVTITNTELEALILETNLIKEMKPKYNVLMKDDKNYLYVKVTVQDQFPRIEAARKVEEDGAKYFGPTTSGYEVRQMLRLLRRLYPFRTCKMGIEVANPLPLSSEGHSPKHTKIPLEVTCTHKDRPTPCLDFHIEQCSAPCIGTKTPEEYFKESIEDVLVFLKGDREPARQLLKERMMQAAADRKFELAAEYRNHLQDLEKMQERQIISDPSGENSDIVGVAVLSMRAHVVVLQRRNGKIVGETHFALAGQAEDPVDVLEQFLPQYYDDGEIPDAILLPAAIPSRATIAQWLSHKKGKKAKILIPERGKKSQLLQMAEKNALEKAKLHEIKWESEERNTEEALQTLQTLLHLPELPSRIEGYDISHLGGTETVGSMVVMKDGKAQNDHYRSFTIRSMQRGTVDDYAALKEVLKRRLRYLVEDFEAEEKAWKENGIEVGKARKADQEEIEKIHAAYQEAMSSKNIQYRDYMVARCENEIVGFGRLYKHTEKLIEMKSIWIAEPFRGQKLGQFIARKILRTVKKGKVYVTADPSLEAYYGELGFRYVLKAPPLLQQSIEEAIRAHHDPENLRTMVLVYNASQQKEDPSLTARPDLLVIDGGKGQLSAVMDVIRGYQLEIPVIGLAKREEEVFLPDQGQPVAFDEESPAKFLLMRLRDEAHRFANRHREKRGKSHAIRSKLDDIPGIGPETRSALLRKFTTISAIRSASDTELLEIVTENQLQALRLRL